MIEIILGALTAGALAATQDTAAQVVKDAYGALKGALVKKFGNLVTPVKQLEEKPDSEGRKITLKEELQTAKADGDSEVLKLAQALTDVLRQQGLQPGKVNTITDNQGIAIQDATVNGDVKQENVGRDKIGRQINMGKGGTYIEGIEGSEVHLHTGETAEDAEAKLTPSGLLLYKAINDYFDTNELEDLCFQLNIDWENLDGTVKKAKARALVAFCEKRGNTKALRALVLAERPNAGL